MSTAELKSHLHKLIVETEDMDILQKVQAYFAVLKTQKADWWEIISDSEKRAIKQGMMELKEGKGIPHSEVKKKVSRLLGR